MVKKSILLSFVLVALFTLGACTTKKDPTLVYADGSPYGSSYNNNTYGITSYLTCSATPSINTVASGDTFSVNLTASGGTAPYTLTNPPTGTAISFGGQTSIATSLINNSTTSSQIVTQTLLVSDSAGNQVSCPYSVTISSNSLSCQILSLNANPSTVQSTTVTVTASGGAASGTTAYTFGDLFVGTIDQGAFTVNGATGSQALYLPQGSQTLRATVTNGSASAVCSATVLVTQPALGINTSVVDADTVQVTVDSSALPQGGTTYYSFSSSDSRVYINQSDNIATVKRAPGASGSYSAFTASIKVDVSSSMGWGPVSASTSISFAQKAGLSCALTPVSSSTVKVGGVANLFDIVATQNGIPAAVSLGQIDAGPYAVITDMGTQSGTLAHRFSVRWANTALPPNYLSYKILLSATASSAGDSSLKCGADNSGAVAPLQVTLTPGGTSITSCSVTARTTNPQIGGSVIYDIAPGTGQGHGAYAVRVDITNTGTGSGSSASINPSYGSVWSAFSVVYTDAGIFSVAVTLTDPTDNSSAYCQMQQQVGSSLVTGTAFTKFGFNFEDKNSDNDYNDAVFCFTGGNFYLNGRTVYSAASQDISLRALGSAAKSHSVRLLITNLYGVQTLNRVYYVPQYSYAEVIHLNYGDKLSAVMETIGNSSSNISTDLPDNSSSEGRYVHVQGNQCNL